jgi:hypothetical protein
MNRRLIVGGVVVVALLVVAAGVAVPAVFAAQKDNSTTSTYFYTAKVSTNAALTDATFYLPLPVAPDGAPTVEDVQVASEGAPAADWTTRVVETRRGPMLAVEAEAVVGEERYDLVSRNGSLASPEPISREEAPANMTGLRLEPAVTRYEILAQGTVEPFGNGIESGLTETRYPRGNASLLSATYDDSPDACGPVWGDEETCTAFQADVYASYDAGPSAIVRVGAVELWGSNEWGWFVANSFNEYTQRVEPVEFEGSHGGWVSVAGELRAGRGSY